MDTENLIDPRRLSDVRIESITFVDLQHTLPGYEIEVVRREESDAVLTLTATISDEHGNEVSPDEWQLLKERIDDGSISTSMSLSPVRTPPFDREFAEHSEAVCKAIIEANGLLPETIGLAISGTVNTLLIVDMTSPRRIHRRWHRCRSARRSWKVAIVAQRARQRHRRHARAMARRRQRGLA